MATLESPNSFKVNDYVKIDGRESGRIMSIVSPLGSYRMFNIRTYTGEMRQVPWYRLAKLPGTVTPLPVDGVLELPSDVVEELLTDDFLSEDNTESVNEREPVYDHSEIDKFINENQNRNTLRKTMSNVKRLQNFMNDKQDFRAIESIPPQQLCDILCTFFIELRKDDGCNYEPSTIRGMLASFDRYLKSKHYTASLINDRVFEKLNSVMKTKQKVLKSEGMGNLPKRAESLTDNDVDKLWESHQLGPNNPESLLNTMWWNNTTHFGLQSVKPHVDMKWGDVVAKRDNDDREYLEFTERQSKTCQGDNPVSMRKVHPKAWATNDNHCPVAMYKLYASRRPSGYTDPDTPFYIATNTKEASATHPWYKRQSVSINKLSSIMKRMSPNAGFTNKKFTNHSARKYLVQKLSDENVPPTHIMQISGHRNMQSVNDYSQISSTQHRSISHILSGHARKPTPIQPISTQSSLPSSAPVDVSLRASSLNHSRVPTQNGLLSSLFAAPIHGGTFNINIYSCDGPSSAKKFKESGRDEDHSESA